MSLCFCVCACEMFSAPAQSSFLWSKIVYISTNGVKIDPSARCIFKFFKQYAAITEISLHDTRGQPRAKSDSFFLTPRTKPTINLNHLVQ